MFIKFIKSIFSPKSTKGANVKKSNKRVYKDSCKHCHGEGDIMLTNVDGSVTGQAFGECSCWKSV